MQEILAGLRSLDSVSGTKHFAQLMEKLSAGSSALMPGGQNILIDLASWYKDSLAPKIAEIRKAMAFDYKKEYKEFYLPPKKPQIIEIPP